MAFDIIPVIDLKGGMAVAASGGDRVHYRPLATPLCPDGDPLTAARGLVGVTGARALYVADLDAIEGRPPQDGAIAALGAALPGVALSVDRGMADARQIAAWQALGIGRAVLGSESMGGDIPGSGADLPAIPQDCILSLDFRGERFLGPRALLDNPHSWPRDVIAMCLHSVGAGGGPDFARLGGIVRAAGPGRRVHAAGGVRHAADLDALAAAGAAGVLVASALHNGAVGREDVLRLRGGPG
jgi:uncharacterized protein related to proFAR isomerase